MTLAQHGDDACHEQGGKGTVWLIVIVIVLRLLALLTVLLSWASACGTR